MTEHTFQVPNITCGHCVATIKNELAELDGVQAVEGDEKSRQITVRWEAPAAEEAIRKLLAEINYPAQ
jgi:copper chaperone CopZ